MYLQSAIFAIYADLLRQYFPGFKLCDIPVRSKRRLFAKATNIAKNKPLLLLSENEDEDDDEIDAHCPR